MAAHADGYHGDKGGFGRRTALARLADAARAGVTGVELGFHEPAEPDQPRLPFARFRPAAAIRFPTRAGDLRDVQTEAAVALGLSRWQPGHAPARAPQWLLRGSANGLELVAPKRLVFTRSHRSISHSWHAAARAHGFVLVAYGYDTLAAGVMPYLDAM